MISYQLLIWSQINDQSSNHILTTQSFCICFRSAFTLKNTAQTMTQPWQLHSDQCLDSAHKQHQVKKSWTLPEIIVGPYVKGGKGVGGAWSARRGAEGGEINEGCVRRMEDDGGGRKRRVSHIPGQMHGAIDSGLLPAHCLHFKESVKGGRRWRRDGGRRGGVYERVFKEGRREGYS